MPLVQPRAVRPLLWIGLLMAAEVVLLMGLHAYDIHLGLPLSLLTVMLFLVPAVWLGGLYWHRIDEAAREAQKTAWYWGGSLGMGLGVIAVSLFARLGFAPADAGPTLLMTYGAVGVVAAQLIGFGIAWALWWARRR
ncbi:MAG: hypothetical protein ABW360_03215 [Phenylobacterium sp.]